MNSRPGSPESLIRDTMSLTKAGTGKHFQKVTYEQKKELSVLISDLNEVQMGVVVDIIRRGVPSLRDTSEEIEIDIDSINPATLYKLWTYVKQATTA